MHTRTTTALLDGLQDPANEAVWHEFDARYRPILLGFAHRVGLGPEDAADVAQEALARFIRAYRKEKYDRTRGRLRSWLIGIVKNCIADLRQQSAKNPQRGMSAIADLPDEDELSEIWDAEYQQEILRKGVDRLQHETRFDEKTVNTFKLLAFEHQAPADVASQMKITLNDVYLAKHRCLDRLRDILSELNELYELA